MIDSLDPVEQQWQCELLLRYSNRILAAVTDAMMIDAKIKLNTCSIYELFYVSFSMAANKNFF
jgi:hypothetical protein